MRFVLNSTVFVLSILSLCFANTFAQTQEDPVMWEVQVLPTETNGIFKLEAQAKIAKGYHIWALEARGDGSLIDTEVEMDDDHKYLWVESEWQANTKPIPVDLDYIDGRIYWYESEVTIHRSMQSDVSMTVEGMIHYQVCNEQYCYPPEAYEFKKMIPIQEK